MTFSNIVHMLFDKKNFAAPNTLLPQTLTEISHSLRRRMARGAAPSFWLSYDVIVGGVKNNEKFPVSKNEVIRNEISSIFLLYIRIFSHKGVHYHFCMK